VRGVLTNYQVLQIHEAILCLLVLVVFYTYARFVRKKAWPPVVGVGALVAVGGAITFVLSFFAAGFDDQARLQTFVKVLRELPVVAIVSYVCLMQARKYRGARNREQIRRWFARAPYVVGGAWVLYLLMAIMFPFPALAVGKPWPLRALLMDATLMVPFAVYGALTSFVFAEALKPGFPGLRRRMQSLSAALGMAAISLIAVNSLILDAVAALGSPRQVLLLSPKLLSAQNAMITVEALGLAVALVCYYTRSDTAEFTERFLRFLDVVDDLTDVVENAPISRAGLNVQYASMGQAAREGFLDLPEEERRDADDAFRVMAIFGHPPTRDGLGGRPSPIAQRLLALTRAYDEEVNNAALSARFAVEGSRLSAQRWALYSGPEPDDTSQGTGGPSSLSSVLGLVETILGGGLSVAGHHEWADFTNHQLWVQLCCVALADTDLLPSSVREAISSADAVSPRVRDAYFLAKYKLFNYRMSSGGVHGF
jgi:hypothetical protein